MFLDPGLLNRRARLEINEPAADAFGGAADIWREIAEISVRLEPITTRVSERFGQQDETATHRVTLRHRPDLARGLSFLIGARRFLVRTVIDPDESGRWLVCRCATAA